MELKAGYKQTEVGVIPEDWKVAPLGELIDYTKGYAFKSGEYTSDGIRVVRVSDTTYDSILEEGAVFISQTKASKYSKWRLKTDDLVVSTVGSKPPMYDSMVGKVVMIQRQHEGALLNQNAVLLRDKKRQPHFQRILLSHLRSRRYLASIESIFRGNANQASITLKELFQFGIPFPSAESEQRAIGAAVSDADALMDVLTKLITKKRDLKQAAMQELLTGKRRLPGFADGIIGYKQTEVGVIPEDWEVHQLGDIGTFKNGINKDSGAFGHGSPFVNLMDVFGVAAIASTEGLGLVASDGFEQKAYNLRRGDVILVRSSVKPSGVGLTAVVENDLPETVYSGFLIRFRDGGLIDTNFKRHCFFEEGFRRRMIGASSVSANTNINQEHLKRLFLALPSTKAEQGAIAEALSDMDADLAALEQRRDKTRALKQGMMQELLTGRIRLV